MKKMVIAVSNYIFLGKVLTFPESCKTSEQQQKKVLKKNKKGGHSHEHGK